ncbi:hypothetical protein DRP05_06115 [Archaeoglobales archaeon]|nr:MAG: hypothetical protein DRP05_06115 [Archaeoglobales archaeon]
MALQLIKKVALSSLFFVFGVLSFLTVYYTMFGFWEFNQALIFVASMIGVICFYAFLHFLR